jgi:hypothetical protein
LKNTPDNLIKPIHAARAINPQTAMNSTNVSEQMHATWPPISIRWTERNGHGGNARPLAGRAVRRFI